MGLQARSEAGGSSGGGERALSPSSHFISRPGELAFGIILETDETHRVTRAASRDAAPALNNPRVALGVKNTPRLRTSTAYSARFEGAPLTCTNRGAASTGRVPIRPIAAFRSLPDKKLEYTFE